MVPRKHVIAVLAAFLVAAAGAVAEEPAPPAARDAGSAGADATPAPAADPEASDAAEAAPDPTPIAGAPVADAAALEADGSPVPEGEGETPVADEAATGAPAADAETAEAGPAADPAPGEEASDPEAEAGPVEEAAAEAPGLGAVGYDSEGRRGRIHVVVRGDTLWDVSNAYLGTPWVWPSIWKDNDTIENPHLIHPGDHIWITPNEMRRLTPEEAALMLSNRPPAAPSTSEDAGLALEQAPGPAPQAFVTEPVDRGSIRVSSRETVGLVTQEQLDASASIVGRVPERILMSQEDELYVGLGEGAVAPGDQFTIFRTYEKVFDPDTRRFLGYHVEFLGFVEVRETYPETALATIEMSTGEIEEGDKLMPREPLPLEIPLQPSPADVDGKISFFPNKRVLMGYNDFVYLNRGSLDGLQVGSPLEVYRPGQTALDETRDERVEIPALPVADMVVVRVEPESAVALVTRSRTDLTLGDRFRGAGR